SKDQRTADVNHFCRVITLRPSSPIMANRRADHAFSALPADHAYSAHLAILTRRSWQTGVVITTCRSADHIVAAHACRLVRPPFPRNQAGRQRAKCQDGGTRFARTALHGGSTA
ncbi:MAG: hypothetical protein ACTHK2_16940, partial [Dokdonella sp.]|uniref:hypothetical protein n=1 Tax=Dokdonella sp. TaxID=2291710 RepID=UPI003F7E0E51